MSSPIMQLTRVRGRHKRHDTVSVTTWMRIGDECRPILLVIRQGRLPDEIDHSECIRHVF